MSYEFRLSFSDMYIRDMSLKYAEVSKDFTNIRCRGYDIVERAIHYKETRLQLLNNGIYDDNDKCLFSSSP